MLTTLALLACTGTADITTEPVECAFGYERGADGLCHEVESDTGSPDTDTDTGADTADTDTDTASETGDTGETDPARIDDDGDGYAEADGDCDDTDAGRSPGLSEVCDGIDNDCDGPEDEGVTTTYYRDVDGDGYGNAASATEACEDPGGHVRNGDDCDDRAETVYPGAADDQGDGMDNDCDGTIDEDWDPCATAWGDLEISPASYRFTEEGGTWIDLTGEGLVCAVTCADPWITAEVADSTYTLVALPHEVDEYAAVLFEVDDPGAPLTTECEVYTSAGMLTFRATWGG